jgi:ribonuclease P protein component
MTKTNLRDSRDFQVVYRSGKRYESHVVTAFVLPNKLGYHRLGITASRKAVGNAVQRNRAKRLLRETFRLTEASLQRLQRKYDWVLNGKGSLLISEVGKPLEEFKRIVGFVASEERINSVNDSQLA